MKKATFLLIIILIVFAGLMTACVPPQTDEPITNEDALPGPVGSDEPIVRATDGEALPKPDNGSTASLMTPQINGIILEINSENTQRLLVDSRMVVEGQVEGEVWVTINEETYFFEDVKEGSSLGISNVSRDFKVGNQVAIFVGPIAESYPMQATALSVYENTEQ